MKGLYGKRFYKYVSVGAASAGIKFVLYSSLYAGGMHYKVAATIAYLTSACFHFMANRHFTFQDRKIKIDLQIKRYLVLTITNYLITIKVISICIEYFSMNGYLSMIIAIAANTITNYLISKYWVFKQPS